MAIYATNEAKEYEKIEPGNYAAVCVQMVEIGTVMEEIQGKKKKMKKVWLRWETPDDVREDGEPFLLSKEYTLSMNEKATLRKDLNSWRGKPFTEEEARRFDITILVGKPCMLNIVHNEKGYANISAVTSVPKNLTISASKTQKNVLSYDSWNEEVFKALPEFVRNKMVKSDEYIEMTAPKDKLPLPKNVEFVPIGDDEADPLPF